MKKKYIRRVVLLTPDQEKAIELEAFQRGEASFASVVRDIVQTWKEQRKLPIREMEKSK